VATSLLEVLGPVGEQALRRAARRRKYRRREIVLRQGDLGDAVYFIERGHAMVKAEGKLDTSLTLNVVGSGDYFGDLAMFAPDRRRSATVEALGELICYEVAGRDFIELHDSQARVRRAITESLARTCQRLDGRLLDARHVDARGRLLHQLGRLQDLFRGPIPFTQDDLAAYVGVTRVTINQILTTLQGEGLVEVRRGSVRLLPPARTTDSADPAGDGDAS
jgi:CRP/FNR family transcriptional regulator, cyclic AMP receptor protein